LWEAKTFKDIYIIMIATITDALLMASAYGDVKKERKT
jgi:hypothetical protein